jgi:hypothetical protein
MKTNSILFRLLPIMLLVFTCFGGSMNVWGQTSTQNFGTGTGTHESITGSTTFLPNPTSGTTWARSGNNSPYPPIVLATASNPLGTTGAYLRAVASSSTSVSKFSPMIDYTGSPEFYTSFKVLFGDASAGATATTGDWSFFQGAGATYSNVNGFSSAHVFVGLQFTFGDGGAIALKYRVTGSDRWSDKALTTLSSATVYTIEIVGNNKLEGTINYSYADVSQTVAVQKFDLYINGILVGDDLAVSALPAGTSINSATFIGISSVSNVANIFVDDVIVYNAVPGSIVGTTTVSRPTFREDAISVYPAQNSNNMILKVDATAIMDYQSMSYQLYDINGKLLQNEMIADNLTTIVMDNLKPSIYFVKVVGVTPGNASQQELKTLKVVRN